MTTRTLALFLYALNLFTVAANAQEIDFKPLHQLTLKKSYSYPAKAISTQQVKLSSQINGSVISAPFEVGDKIKQNQVLISLDCTDHQLLKQQSQAALNRLNTQKDLAQQQLKRAMQLVAIKSISSQELEQKQTALDANIASIAEQQASLSIIKNTINKCKVKAPFSGVIVEKYSQKGSFITPATPFAQLINPQAIEIESDIPTDLVKDLKSAQTIRFKQHDKIYPIHIRTVLPLTNANTHLQTVRFTLKAAPYPLSNSLGQITWTSPKKLIPARYIVRRDDQLGVFIKSNKQVIFKSLPSAIEGQNSPTSLKDSTLIATNKLLILKDKDQVK